MTSSNSKKLLSMFMASLMLALAFTGVSFIAFNDDDSSAATLGSGTQADPYTFIDIGAHSGNILNSSYVLVGSSITLTNDDYDDIDYNVNDVTSGYGLTVNYQGVSGTLTGTAGQTVTIVVDWVDYGGDSGTYYHTFTIVAASTHTVSLSWTVGTAVNYDTGLDDSSNVTGYNKYSGTMPTGVNYSTTGGTVHFTGTPSEADNFTVTFKKQNYNTSSWITTADTYVYNITVTAATPTSYTHSIQYQAGGDNVTGMPNSQTVTNTSSTYSMKISSAVPERAGYTFIGWSYNGNTYQPGASISVGSNATVYLTAQWQSKTITITSSQSNTAMTTSQSFNYSLTSNISGATLTISGANWLSSSSNGTTYTVNGVPATAGTYDVTLTLSKEGYTSATQSFTITVENVLAFTSNPTSGFYVVG